MRVLGLALRHIGAVLAGASVLAAVLFAAYPATASCDQSGSTVSCFGTTNAYDAGTQSGITVTVQPGATVIGSGGTAAITITNPSGLAGDTLINNGTINGFVTILSSGFLVDKFFNNGILEVTDPLSPLQSHSLFVSEFFQSATGTFVARVDANGFNDNILSGAATLAGRLAIVVQPGVYTAPITYTFVNSIFAPIAGAFDSVTATSPFFTISTSNTVDVTLTPLAFNAVAGLTPNQQHVADVLQNLYAAGTPTGDAATFYSNLFAASSVSVFDQLSGAGAAAAQNVSIDAAGLFNDAMYQQAIAWLGETSNANFGPPLQYAASRKLNAARDAFAAVQPQGTRKPAEWRAWGLGFGSSRSINGQAGLADQSMQTGGGAIGFERVFADLLIGAAAGRSGSHFSVSSLSTSGNVDGGHLGIYAVKRWSAFYAAVTLNYARFENSVDRMIAGIGPTESAHGRFASDQLGGRLELGLRHGFGQHTVTPFVAIEPAVLWQHAYTESSTTAAGGPGVLGLDYSAHQTNSLPAFLGAQINTNYLLPNGQVLRPFLRAAWVHELFPARQISANFISIPGASFTVDGARPSPDAARIGAGTVWSLGDSKALFAKVNAELSRSGTAVAGMAGAKMTW